MQLPDICFANLNAISHVGGRFSTVCGQHWKWPESRYSQHILYYILEGGCTIRINGQDYPGFPGRCFFIPAGTLYSYTNDPAGPFSKHWMHFDLLPREPDLFSALKLPYYIDTPPGGVMEKLFADYSGIAASKNLSDKLQVKALLLNILSEYIRLSGGEDVCISGTESDKSQQLLMYIQDHLREELSNGALAQLLHMQTRSFIRFFKKLTGFTPARYIMARRMELAKNLLEETDLPVSDIMRQIGMEDLPHFSRRFKQHFAVSPRHYRELLNHNHRPCRWYAQAPLGPVTSRAYRLIEFSFACVFCPTTADAVMCAPKAPSDEGAGFCEAKD